EDAEGGLAGGEGAGGVGVGAAGRPAAAHAFRAARAVGPAEGVVLLRAVRPDLLAQDVVGVAPLEAGPAPAVLDVGGADGAGAGALPLVGVAEALAHGVAEGGGLAGADLDDRVLAGDV